MIRELLQECLKNVQAAVKAAGLYPPGHPGIREPATSFVQGLRTLLERGHPIVLGFLDDILVFDEIPFYETETTWRTLFVALRDRRLEAITFRDGFDVEEMSGVVDILRGEDSTDLETLWKRHEIVHASYRELQDDLGELAQRTYHACLGVVMNLVSELRMGKVPSSGEAIRIVDEMRDIILQDPNAMLGMAMMKAYDEYTFNHSVNVSLFCLAAGRQMELEPDRLRALGLAGLLHDLGKARTDEAIIRKPGALDDEELKLMKLHPELGAEILQNMAGINTDALAMVLQHHVRYDRKGYPDLPAGTEIDPLAEAVALADCYDALTTTRPYQRARHPGDAARIIRRGSGSAYSPELVDSFLDMLGAYPIGECVRLASGEIGVVVANNSLDIVAPTIRLVMDADGNRLIHSVRVELSKPGESHRRIVAPVDPFAKNIDAAAILDDERNNKGEEGEVAGA